MDADDVEGVVVAEAVLEGDGQAAGAAGDQADRDRAERGDRSGRGVMATRPATAPEAPPSVVACPSRRRSVPIQASRAAAVATRVFRKARQASPSAASAEPALKPNQPNHSSPAPSTTNGRLWGRIGSRPKPVRLPSTSTRASAAAPALMCTAVPPAKSSAPSRLTIQPPLSAANRPAVAPAPRPSSSTTPKAKTQVLQPTRPARLVPNAMA